jgi:hypothetical protein
MECPECKGKYDIKDVPNSAVQMLRLRYDKLRPSLASTTSEVNVHHFTEVLDRIAALDNTHDQHSPVITH